MEKPTSFDLNQAIHQWRESLADSPALGGGDVEELETHLRDSVLNLQARGLSLEEAFLVARQRLGPPPELQQEFGKLNGRRVWLDRAVWMLLGVMAVSWLNWSANIASIIVTQTVMRWSDNGHWIGLSHLLSRWLSMALIVLGCYELLKRWHKPIQRLANLCVRRPFIPVLLICLLNFTWHPLARWVADWTSLGLHFSLPETTTRLINHWIGRDQFLWIIIMSGSFLFLLRRYYSASSSSAIPFAGRNLDSWPVSVQEQDRSLQSLGLSLPEALLVVKKRQTPVSLLMDHTGQAEFPAKWLGRCLWMLAGVIMNDALFANLVILMERPFYRLTAWWPQYDYYFGFLLILASWAMVAGIATLLWRIAVHQKLSRLHQFARWAANHLVMGSLALSALWLSFQVLIAMPFALISWGPLPGPSGLFHSILPKCSGIGYQILHYVFLVLLLFWLARRTMNWRRESSEIQSAAS